MREPAAFSFVLTKEDGARIYGTSLVFDEEIPPEIVDQVDFAFEHNSKLHNSWDILKFQIKNLFILKRHFVSYPTMLFLSNFETPSNKSIKFIYQRMTCLSR